MVYVRGKRWSGGLFFGKKRTETGVRVEVSENLNKYYIQMTVFDSGIKRVWVEMDRWINLNIWEW